MLLALSISLVLVLGAIVASFSVLLAALAASSGLPCCDTLFVESTLGDVSGAFIGLDTPSDGAIMASLVPVLMIVVVAPSPVITAVVSAEEVDEGTIVVVYGTLPVSTSLAEGLSAARLVVSCCCSVFDMTGAVETETELDVTVTGVTEFASVQLEVADNTSILDVLTTVGGVLLFTLSNKTESVLDCDVV